MAPLNPERSTIRYLVQEHPIIVILPAVCDQTAETTVAHAIAVTVHPNADYKRLRGVGRHPEARGQHPIWTLRPRSVEQSQRGLFREEQ